MNSKQEKVGRNDPCPCNSGKKYKKCCMGGQAEKPAKPVDLKKLYRRKYDIMLKTAADIEGIRKAGRLVMETHALVREMIRPGLVTDEINALVHAHTVENGGVPAPLNYRGYPKSVCVSVNEVICHGIPGERVLEEGDIVNVDITSIVDGYYADANITHFVGTPGPDARKIVDVARESLKRGLAQIRPGNHTGDIGWAIQQYAEGEGCSVVREFVGHGVGIEFHEAPQILHFGNRGEGVPLVPGMVFTVEPMINLGKFNLDILDDNWTAVTRDGSLSAQFEQTVLVTEEGYESMTPFDL